MYHSLSLYFVGLTMPETMFPDKRKHREKEWTSFMKNHLLFRLLLTIILLCAFLLPASAISPETESSSAFLVTDALENGGRIESLIAALSLHEKVCQLFFLQPEQFSLSKLVYASDETFFSGFNCYPVGGVILFSRNIVKGRIADLNAGMQKAAAGVNGIGLLIGVDEEGGSISRVANKLKLREKQPGPSRIADADRAYASAVTIGTYLTSYGFNVNFAPVADVRTAVKDAEMTYRCYSNDPYDVAEKVVRFVEGSHKAGIIPVLKHFPGLGAVSGNTHKGTGFSMRTPEDWRLTEFIPFSAGIQAMADIVMVSHQVAVNVDPDAPASLSPVVIAYLREELGFEGIIITDALRMNAIRKKYGSGEACVMALEAGVDMLLLPDDFTDAYEGVMEALESGRLTEERIDKSLCRILTLKTQYGLLP